MQYLSENNIVTPYQHGFTTKKLCFTNLLEIYKNLTLVVDSGCGVDVIYLDYIQQGFYIIDLRNWLVMELEESFYHGWQIFYKNGYKE